MENNRYFIEIVAISTHQTFEALQQAIEDYIQFYNNDRYQERLNGLSPLEYRAKAA
ncbi:IS3 family transposase [Lysinibacillus sphaericus]|uniref:IS3 family transposase n=1 Tax=Lysinibacillus sphaericus TaxID=1421 RepID=UPI0009B832FC